MEPSGYLFGFVELKQLDDNKWEVPSSLFHLYSKQIDYYHIVVHMNCQFPRNEEDFEQLAIDKIITLLEKVLSDKGVNNARVHVAVTDYLFQQAKSLCMETTLTKNIELNMKLHSGVTKWINIEELTSVLVEYLSPGGYKLDSKPLKGYLDSNNSVTLKDGNMIPQGTQFNYYPEGKNTHYLLQTVDADYEIHYTGMENIWMTNEPIKLEKLADPSKKVLTLIITYYFEVHKDDLNQPPLSAKSITDFLAQELASEGFGVLSVHVLPHVSNVMSYTVELNNSTGTTTPIHTPEALIGVNVITQNADGYIPEVHSKLLRHFTVSADYQVVNYWVLPQVPGPTE